MKKVFGIISVAAAVALLASCQKENLGNISTASGESVEFTVAIGDGTRTTIDAEGKTFWEKGDKLAVFDGANTGIAVIPDAADGQASAIISATGVSATAESYTIVYPASDELTISASGINAKFATEQSGKFADAQFAVGYAGTDNVVKMANISSVISFETADANVTSVEFTSLNDDDEFPTEATLTKVTGSKNQDSTAVEITNTAASIKVNVSGEGKYYAAFFPFAQPVAGFKITVNTTSGSKEITAEVPVSFTAGKMVNLGSIDGREGKAYKSVSKVGFGDVQTVVSGNIDEEGNFTYESFKGGAGTAPGVFSQVIRLYQKGTGNEYGGYIEITSKGGDKIAGIHMDVDNNTTIAYSVDGAEFDASTAQEVKYYSGVNLTGLNAGKVTVYCLGTNKDTRLYIKSINVTYIPDARQQQSLSFPKASYDATIGETFMAPAVSGAQTTVTYSSSDETVATVDASTGAVTLVAAGNCTITANAAEDDTYKAGTASYTLNVFASAQGGIKGIKELIRAGAGTEVSFKTSVTDMIVTFARTDDYPYTAYLEESNGQAIYFYNTQANPFAAAGEKYNGTISGKGKVYNGACEITEINLGEATKSTGDVPLTTVTIAELNANYAAYEYRNIKIEGATATTALTASGRSCTIAQGDNTMTLYTGVKGAATIDEGAVIDVVCHPDYHNEAYQCIIWSQNDITVKGGANVVTMDETKSLTVGDTWSIGATCLSGDPVSYAIVDGSDVISISGGTVTALSEGTAVIKATSVASGIYTAGEATCSVTVNPAGGVKYTKVTSNLTDWSGEYLLAAISGDKTLVWTGVDAGKCHTDLETTDATISGSDFVSIIVAKMDGGYSIKVNGGEKNGQYISQSTTATVSYQNALKFNKDPHPIQIEMKNPGVVEIWQVVNETQNMYLLYNKTSGSTNERFRFYKDSNFGQSNYITPSLFKKN